MAQNSSPERPAPVPIVGTKQPAMTAAPKTALVELRCNPAFSHLYGEPTQTSAGQAHVGSDGTLLEPPAIAAALLEARVPIDGKENPIFTVSTADGLQLVKDYLAQKLGAAHKGEELGRLVYIECQSLAGESSVVGETKVHFDAGGLAVVGERIYHKMRPAFGGDGTIPDAQNPTHLLFFKCAVTSSDATQEEVKAAFTSDLDGDVAGSLGGSLDGDSSETVQDEDGLEEDGAEAALQLGVEVEDTDLTPPAEQLTPAAKALADFNAAPPLAPGASVVEPATDPLDDSAPVDSAPLDSTDPPEDTVPTFWEQLAEVIGSDRAQILAENKLGDEASLRAADKKTLLAPKGIGDTTANAILDFLKSHPAEDHAAA